MLRSSIMAIVLLVGLPFGGQPSFIHEISNHIPFSLPRSLNEVSNLDQPYPRNTISITAVDYYPTILRTPANPPANRSSDPPTHPSQAHKGTGARARAH